MRRGLILGGGGVLGGAWMIGALTALEEHEDHDAREFDVIVGTSAGAVVGSLLAAGVSVADLRRHQLRGRVDTGPLADLDYDHDTAVGAGRPMAPKAGFGSFDLIRHNARQLADLPPMTVIAALLPEGNGRLDNVGRMIRHVVPSGWVGRDGLAVTAVDYEVGDRVAFGRTGSPQADLAEAVMASCAIPAWYEPVRIGSARYIDGGAWSSTNVDLALGQHLDEVVVIAPQISFDLDSPDRFATKIERRWRARVTNRVLGDVQRVHAEGPQVTLLGPGHEDLEAFGPNMMDTTRRALVIETSLRTSLRALRAPGPLPQPVDPPPSSASRAPVAAEASDPSPLHDEGH